MSIIETFGLTKVFGSLTAVHKIDLKVEAGEIFGLLGPNGAGKTTLLMMLSTLLKPSSGSARVNGFDIRRNPSKVRESIGMVFQDPSSDDILTGYENLRLHALLYDLPESEAKDRIRKVLKLVDLYDRRDDQVKKYSGGMRRRLELARGLLHNPKVLFLDEPTLGLDPQTREHVWQYIERLVKEENVTIVITTHYMEEADRLCDRVAIIDHGRIVVLDSPRNLKSKLGGDMVRLRLTDAHLENLGRFSFVKRIEKTGDVVTLTVENVGKNLPEMLKALGGAEIVEVRPSSLNDVFLHYTGRAIRAEAETPEGGWWERAVRARVSR